MNKKLFLYFILFFIHTSISFGQQKSDRFESTILEIEQEDEVNGYQQEVILFTGSSSIRMWKSLDQDMDPMPAINRGFGGSTIPEVTYYANRIILPHHPKMTVFYCGENDLANDEAKLNLVLKSFKAFHKYLRENLPDAKLFFIAIKPSIRRWNYWPKFQEANQKIKRFIDKKENYYFIDTATKMLDKNGVVLQHIFIEDNLHMNVRL